MRGRCSTRSLRTMHELALCQALLTQVGTVARDAGRSRVTRIRLEVGPLSGAVPALLESAWVLARAGTVADGAVLEIRIVEVRACCDRCAAEFEAPPNRLVCPCCGNWQTRLLSGDELILRDVELGDA